MQSNVTIIIPIYNEEENIGLLIDKIFNYYSKINILVVDDLSEDSGAKIVRNKIGSNINKLSIIIINNKKYKGLTNSIIKGIISVKTEYFIVMDGDFQHPVENIINFINFFDLGKDIVIGERKKIIFKKKYRIIISKFGNILINLKLKKNGIILKDPLSGFFGGKTKYFVKNIEGHKEIFIGSGYKFLFEFLKILKRGNIKLGTFDFNFGIRKFGKSKMNSNIWLNFIKGLIK